MPLIAKEVVIKVTIQESAGNKGKEPAAGKGNGQAGNPDIISTCVEKVLEILKEKKEP